MRRQVILPPEVLDELDRRAPKQRARSSLNRGVGMLGRYGLTRLVWCVLLKRYAEKQWTYEETRAGDMRISIRAEHRLRWGDGICHRDAGHA